MGSTPVRPTFLRQMKQRFLLGVVLALVSPSLGGDGAVRSESPVVRSSAWSQSARERGGEGSRVAGGEVTTRGNSPPTIELVLMMAD